MMFFLRCDVSLHRLTRWHANGERGIAFLPSEGLQANLFMYPNRRGFFQFAHNVRQTMGGFQSDQKVNVISHTANALRESAVTGDGTAQIFVQASTPFRRNDDFAFLRCKDQMVVQAQICGSHLLVLQCIMTLRPLPGSFDGVRL